MVIELLPVFEADADPANRDALSDADRIALLKPPKTIVVRFGFMKLVGEYPYDGDATPGCGSKLVVRTHRGTELGEMLTTTCENAGCGKSVTRQEMRDYIDNSGGKDFPFYTDGRILRVATLEDLTTQTEIMAKMGEAIRICRQLIKQHEMPMTLVDAEPILGGEVLTFFYMSEERVDFRALVKELASEFHARIDMRQVGARDEARLVADYERCGQHCCCKSFLKVLKPVSMRAAKVQKATLDPLKISGRCGRLMCCLRYEDQTYKELKKNLPHRKTRVGTAHGPGLVVDTKILVQLVLVKLEHNNEEVAVPVEELMDPNECPSPAELEKERQAAAIEEARQTRQKLREESATEERKRSDRKSSDRKSADRKGGERKGGERKKGRGRDRRGKGRKPETGDHKAESPATKPAPGGGIAKEQPASEGERKGRRRRRGRGKGGSDGPAASPSPSSKATPKGGSSAAGGEKGGGRRSRRRSRRGRGKGGGDTGGGGGPPSSGEG